jgi:RNA polymerase sigma factor (sigma-70 family)
MADHRWDSPGISAGINGADAEYIGQAWDELRNAHGPDNIYPGALFRRAHQRHRDERRCQARREDQRQRNLARFHDRDLDIAECSAQDDRRARHFTPRTPESIVCQHELNLAIYEAIQGLPSELSAVVEARFFKNASVKSIACSRSCTARTVYNNLKRGLTLLRERLSEFSFEA